MTIDQFWEKYNRCPLCYLYTSQNESCQKCKWIHRYREDGDDNFFPSEIGREIMNRNIQEAENDC